MKICKSLAEWISEAKDRADDFDGRKCNDIYLHDYLAWINGLGHKVYYANYISFIDNLCAATGLKVYVAPDKRGWPTYEVFDRMSGYDRYDKAWHAAAEADRENYWRERHAQAVTSDAEHL